MELDFLGANIAFVVARSLVGGAFVLGLLLLAGMKVSKASGRWFVVIFVALVGIQIFLSDGPRVKIVDSTPSAPIMETEGIGTDAPPKQSNEDRLKYNRELIEENALTIFNKKI